MSNRVPDGRAELVDVAQSLDAAGLMPNKSGNVSIRTAGGFVITPAGTPYCDLTASSLVELENGDTPSFTHNGDTPAVAKSRGISGNQQPADGPETPKSPGFPARKPGVSPFSGKPGVSPFPRPSSEWRTHAAIYHAYPAVGAIVHTHSPQATALACAGLGLPPFHYMIALAGGEVRCMPYATFGSAELAHHAVRGLEDRRATLLANHGVIAVGPTLRVAHAVALEVENLAGQWLALRAAGLRPQLLDAEELARVIEKFAGYGRLG
jgi:L-fuculose-phosphate aldolase